MRARQSWYAAVFGLVAVAAVLVPLSSVARTVVPHAQAAAALDRLPLAFEANEGQFDPAVRFLARTPGQNVLLTGTGLTLSPSGVVLSLVGAREDVPIEAGEPMAGHVSRFVGDDPARWTTGASTFGSVTYRQVYPGIDVVFHGRGRHVEHDFVVAPGTDPGVIGFSVHGARIDARGDLRVGDVTLQAPELYQDHDGERRPVRGAFERRGDAQFGFTVGAYDPSRPLVIDPVLVSGSYYGGSSTDTAYGVATDADGNMILTGYTESSDLITVNPAQPSQAFTEGTRTDIFVVKVRADGSSQMWSTYLGGKGRDAALAVAIGPDGSVYLTGYTESSDFPTVKPVKATNSGGSDVFVLKLNAAGSAVDFATYIGGIGTDTGNGIAVDQSGGVYVAGTTGSANFMTARPFQPTLSRPDDQDGFVLKLESSLTSLAWSSYLGGGGDDHGTDIAIDREGNAYVTGDTKSTNFPVSRPFQPAPGGSAAGVGGSFADAFVVKVKADGTGLVFGSYLGGSDSDKGSGVAVDAEGNMFVAGNTGSANFPVVNAAQPKKDGDFDAFIAKVKADGTGLAYSTYLGGSGSDGAEAITVDAQGHALVAGATASANFPTEKAFQSARGGGFVDAFLTDVAVSGNSFVSSSYLGGRDDDQAAGIALDRTGNVAIVGYTNSADFPIAKAFQPGRGGGVGDAFVTKVRQDASASSSGSGASATTERDRRVRTLVTLTGGLFLAAILQSVWLRRRPKPAPAGADGAPGGPGGPRPEPAAARDETLPGVAYTPRKKSRKREKKPKPEPVPAPEREREMEPVGAWRVPDQPDATAPWTPDKPWKRSATGPDWDSTQRPLLRPLERAPSPAEAPRMPAPDLWEPSEPEETPSPEVVVAAARAPAPRRAVEPRRPVRPARAPSPTLELDPEDVWGPLTDVYDPNGSDDWGIGDAAAIEAAPEPEPEPEPEPVAIEPPPPPAPPAPPAARLRSLPPEPAVEPQPEPEPVAAASAFAHVVFDPEPEPEDELDPFAALAGAPQPVAPPPRDWPPAPPITPAPPPAAWYPPDDLAPPNAEDWDAAVYPPPLVTDPALEDWDVAVEADPFAPSAAHDVQATQAADAPDLSLDELLDGDQPIPDAGPPEPEQIWLNELLDEEFPIPEPPPEPPPPPRRAPAPEPDPDDFLPPPPDRLLQNLFEPDPSDPLVKATRSRRGRRKDG